MIRFRRKKRIADLQMYFLVGIPLVGILSNAALGLHFGNRIEALFSPIEMRLQVIIDKISDLDNRVSVLEDRGTC
jgi:hypothetical protein